MTKIYIITNTENNKVYVGKTTGTLLSRFGRHLSDSEKFIHRSFYADIQKFGWKVFDIKLLEECDDNISNQKEQYWIKYFNSFNEGYNETIGGAGRQISNDNIIKLYKQGLNCKEVAENLGFCPETVSKYLKDSGIAIRKVVGTADDVNAKAIEQYSLDGKLLNTYYSCRAAGRALGDENKSSHIRESASGIGRKTAYGYVWKWV